MASQALRPALSDPVPFEALRVAAYRIPTDARESDGTYEWDATTMVLVEADAGGETGVGFSYTAAAAADLIVERFSELLIGRDVMATPGLWQAMVHAVRNVGRPGIASTAIAAVDIALWDLKAKLLDVSLLTLLGAVRREVPVYGSGGFTSYSVERLQQQLGEWAEAGIDRVKMKVGHTPGDDIGRVQAARAAIGDAELFVDANGAYTRKQALGMGEAFAASGVTWFEEPVSSDDLEGLRLLRDRAPAGMDIAAGEYGYDLPYFRRMLEAGAVDVLQADGTRCAGLTGFLAAGALCAAAGVPLSAHTAPSVHAHACCALPAVCHLEYFYDHVLIERMLFDGALEPVDGGLRPDTTRPGLGIEFRRSDAEQYRL